ncbi:hypothetical protein BYT27DRAFT_7252454 [Phlegmacium glaucopus]|nr:hypothetical protein BYT27DRAFT_7252454 [Phlegmacium glaucopus]
MNFPLNSIKEIYINPSKLHYYLWSDPPAGTSNWSPPQGVLVHFSSKIPVSTRLTKRSLEAQPVTTISSPEITPEDGFASHPIGEPMAFELAQSFLDKLIPTTVLLVEPTISPELVMPLAVVLPSPVTPDKAIVEFPVEQPISDPSMPVKVPAALFVYPTNILDLSFMKLQPDEYMYHSQVDANTSAEAGDLQHVSH